MNESEAFVKLMVREATLGNQTAIDYFAKSGCNIVVGVPWLFFFACIFVLCGFFLFVLWWGLTKEDKRGKKGKGGGLLLCGLESDQ